MEGNLEEAKAEETEFLYKHPQYLPVPKGEPTGDAVALKAEDVVSDQVAHYAMRMEDEAAVVRANINTQHFLLSLEALSGAKKGTKEFHALVMGLVSHHIAGHDGVFNGRDNDALFTAANTPKEVKKRRPADMTKKNKN